MEKFPQKKTLPEENSQKSEKENIESSSRRRFLKNAVILTGAAAMGGTVSFLSKEYFVNKKQKLHEKLEEDLEEVGKLIEIQIAQYELVLGKKFETPDGQIIDEISEKEMPKIGKKLSKTLNFKAPEEITLNMELANGIKRRWMRNYGEGGKMHDDLLDGLERMGPWFKFISEPFKKENHRHEILNANADGYKTENFSMDPEKLKKYVYLSIPESHFIPDAKSSFGAVGAYQFIKSTANHAFVNVNSVLDERLDPAKSAEGCANNIAYLYNACKKDEALTLSGYNKHYIWQYLSQEDGEASYEKFLKFIQDDVNSKKSFFKNEKNISCEYKVAKGDTLWKISKKFYCRVEDIKKENNLEGDNISKGVRIKIPLINLKQRELLYYDSINIDGLIENLNYPAKFEAVMEIIERLRKEGKIADIDPENHPVSNIKLKKTNGKQSLASFCKNKKAGERMKKLNPHILSSRARLPEGTNVYF